MLDFPLPGLRSGWRLKFPNFSDKAGIEQQSDTIQKHEGAVQHQFTGAVWPSWKEQALICSDGAQDDQDR